MGCADDGWEEVPSGHAGQVPRYLRAQLSVLDLSIRRATLDVAISSCTRVSCDF